MPETTSQDPNIVGLGWGLGPGAWGLELFFSCSNDLNKQLRNTALKKGISAVEARLQRIKKRIFFFSVVELAVLTSDMGV